jgi:hypothetical protein
MRRDSPARARDARALGVDRCATSMDFEFDRRAMSMDGARGCDRDRRQTTTRILT